MFAYLKNIYCIADKTELVIFIPQKINHFKHLNFQISNQKIAISNRVKYFEIKINQQLLLTGINISRRLYIPKLTRAIMILPIQNLLFCTHILVKFKNSVFI